MSSDHSQAGEQDQGPEPVVEGQPTPAGTFTRSLGPVAVTAQGVAAIGLTGTAMVNIPQAVALVGDNTWICFLVASLVILLITETLITFKKVPAAADGIAGFVRDRFGERPGNLAAWSLLLGYVGNSLCCLTVFGVFLDHFFRRFGLGAWPVLGFLVGGLVCYAMARKDVQMSAMTMLGTESLSVLVVLGLCGLILVSLGQHTPASGSLPVEARTLADFQKALMIAVLSFVGFESTATLGQETIDPLKTVPRSLRWSVWISAGLFLVWAVVLGIGLEWLPAHEQGRNNALILLTDQMQYPWAGTLISLGGFVCFFGATLANLTAQGRVTCALAERGYLPARLAVIDRHTHTPAAALTASSVVVIAVCCLLSFCNLKPPEMFDSTGFFAVLGFLFCYLMVALTACFPGGHQAGWWWRFLPVITTVVLLAVSIGFVVGSAWSMFWVIMSFFVLIMVGGWRAWSFRGGTHAGRS